MPSLLRPIRAFVLATLLVGVGCGESSDPEGQNPQEDRDRGGSRVRMGLALVSEGHVEGALEQFRKLREEGGPYIGPGEEPPWAQDLVRQLIGRRELALADSLLDAAGPLEARSAGMRHLTANLRVLQGRRDEALAAYRSVEGPRELMRRVHHEMATLHLQEGRAADALDEAGKALALAPEDASLHLLQAEALRRLGRTEEALAACRAVAPGAKRWVMEGEIFLEDLDRPDSASTLFTRALAESPAIPNVRFLLGRSLLASGNPQRARKALEPLATREPPFPGSREQLFVCYRALGFESRADSLQRQLDLESRQQRRKELRARGIESSVAGDLETALRNFESALELAPGDADLHNDRGAVLARLERWEEAEREFLEAARLDPTDPTFHENLARLYHRTGDEGRKDEAVARWRELTAARDSIAKVDKP